MYRPYHSGHRVLRRLVGFTLFACLAAGGISYGLSRGGAVPSASAASTSPAAGSGSSLSAADARAMLRRLSGRKHFVYTGVAVAENSSVRSFVQKTEVEFYELSDETIENYVATLEPMDKAGAYGIQGKGSVLVKGIVGDYFNVMGFPAAETARFLGLVK